MIRSKQDKRPTWTSLILEALAKTDDFMTAKQLGMAAGAARNQVSAALHHLRNRHVVDCLSSDNQLFWFATPESDDRERAVEERRPEEPGTRRRRAVAKKV